MPASQTSSPLTMASLMASTSTAVRMQVMSNRSSRLMSATRMTDLMLTGRTLSAEKAESLNLVHYVVGKDEQMTEARRLAAQIATNAELSNYAITNALSRIQDLSHDDGLFFESLMAAFTQTTPDASLRLKAFLEKRTARVAPPTA